MAELLEKIRAGGFGRSGLMESEEKSEVMNGHL